MKMKKGTVYKSNLDCSQGSGCLYGLDAARVLVTFTNCKWETLNPLGSPKQPCGALYVVSCVVKIIARFPGTLSFVSSSVKWTVCQWRSSSFSVPRSVAVWTQRWETESSHESSSDWRTLGPAKSLSPLVPKRHQTTSPEVGALRPRRTFGQNLAGCRDTWIKFSGLPLDLLTPQGCHPAPHGAHWLCPVFWLQDPP